MSNSPEDQSETEETPASALERAQSKLHQPGGWHLSPKLFGDVGTDIYDFCVINYKYFLDAVESQHDLERGLDELSPLADDALRLVKMWDEDEFTRFKEELAKERAAEEDSTFPPEWLRLLVPDRFVPGTRLADQVEAPLGAMLIRVLECESCHE